MNRLRSRQTGQGHHRTIRRNLRPTLRRIACTAVQGSYNSQRSYFSDDLILDIENNRGLFPALLCIRHTYFVSADLERVRFVRFISILGFGLIV